MNATLVRTPAALPLQPAGMRPATLAAASEASLSSSADTAFDAQARRLDDIARRIEIGDAQAEPLLRALLAELSAPEADPACVGLVVFAAGLARRLAGNSLEQANLYLTPFEVPQIELFNLLGRAVPFVGMATQICNAAIAGAIEGQPLPTLIDIGMGTGRQFALLLRDLAARQALPQHLTVIGIEPSEAALSEARRHLLATADELGASLCFLGIAKSAEDLSAADWLRVQRACTARPVINASFALHHIADDAAGYDQRNAVLRRLRAFDPVRLVLAEPDVDHLTRSYHRRFRNCFAHFGAVFRALDALPLAQRERDALKVGFFGREIADILGTPEAQRSERHERAGQWRRRLHECGFEVSMDIACAMNAGAAAAAPGVVQVAATHGHVSLQTGSEPVVALMSCRPRSHAMPPVHGVAESAIF